MSFINLKGLHDSKTEDKVFNILLLGCPSLIYHSLFLDSFDTKQALLLKIRVETLLEVSANSFVIEKESYLDWLTGTWNWFDFEEDSNSDDLFVLDSKYKPFLSFLSSSSCNILNPTSVRVDNRAVT